MDGEAYEFDPKRLQPGEDPGIWVIKKELFEGRSDRNSPCADTLRIQGAATGWPPKPVDPPLSEAEIRTVRSILRPYDVQIARLKPAWNLELRSIMLQKIEQGDTYVYPWDQPSDEAQEALQSPNTLHRILPGPNKHESRMIVIDPQQHARMLNIHSRIMTASSEREHALQQYLRNR